MKLIPEIKAVHRELTKWRRHLHAHPETAFEEIHTGRFVAEKLAEFGIEVSTGLARTGVVGTLRNGPGRSVALRADMDALHIEEANDLPYRSTQPGKMHACGHDGHTTMLLGAARYLAGTRNFAGTIHFVFQPAEENEGGGRVMVEEGLFEKHPAEAIFALHNWPGVEAGRFGIRSGPIMASYDIFDIEVIGQGSHGAMPHLGRDPLLTGAQIVQALQRIVSREVNPLEAAVLSVTQFHAGDAYNVIPARAVLKGTVRCFSETIQAEMARSIERVSRGTAEAAGCTVELRYERRYPPTINAEEPSRFADGVAAEIVGDENIIRDMPASMGSEDFSFMLAKRPGAYVRLGNGSADGGCVLHSPNYNFNDDLLPIGATYFVRLAEKFLQRGV